MTAQAIKFEYVFNPLCGRMQALSGSGAPRLLVTVGDHAEVVQSADLHGGAAAVTAAISAIAARAH